MPFLPRNACDLYYESHGSGPAIVFAHGLGGNHLSWWQQVPHFRERYTCVTFAHRGFAPSVEAPGGPGLSAFIDDLSALIDHLELPTVRLVAQSMGGYAALGYTLRHPERVRALVMADTMGSLDPGAVGRPPRGAIAQRRAELDARGIHPAAGERMAREQPALHFLYQELSALSVGLDKEALRAALGRHRTTPPEVLASLGVPVLCIVGEEDILISVSEMETFAGLIPGARLERVPQAGHSVYFERAETFNRLIDDFLRTVD